MENGKWKIENASKHENQKTRNQKLPHLPISHDAHHRRFSPCFASPLRAIICTMFAEVAVPVHVRQTFTYRLPGDMAARASVGSRVLAPFGKKFLTAFIVDLHENLHSDVDESDIKDIEELLDESPIITPEIMELTRWISDYYFAPWGECLRAALPAGAVSISEQMLSLTEAGRDAL